MLEHEVPAAIVMAPRVPVGEYEATACSVAGELAHRLKQRRFLVEVADGRGAVHSKQPRATPGLIGHQVFLDPATPYPVSPPECPASL